MEKISYPVEIQRFFDVVVDRIRKVLDPELILIAGSFGKGSWLYDGDELLSDFEFIFIRKKRWSLKKKKKLLNDLRKDFSHDISLKGYILKNVQKKIISNYSSQYLGYLNLPFYDTFKIPNILYNKNNLDYFELTSIELKEVPVWEAWKLVVNRIGDILLLYSNENVDHIEEKYYWLKVFESISDSILILKNLYSPLIKERYEKFEYDILMREENIEGLWTESFPILKQSLKARLEHNLALFSTEITFKKKMLMLNNWNSYLQHQLLNTVGNYNNLKNNFHESYMSNIELKKAYLDTNKKYNPFLSNLIRLIYNPKLINSEFKYYNMSISWRHFILLTISSIHEEFTKKKNANYEKSKQIFKNLFSEKKLKMMSDKRFILTVLAYWKKLR